MAMAFVHDNDVLRQTWQGIYYKQPSVSQKSLPGKNLNFSSTKEI
jgi:hypothetical protein